MENPKIRYYLDGRVHSDWVEVAVGEAVVVARLQKVEDGTIQWVDQSGLPLGQTDCLTHGQEDGESGQEGGQGDGGVQAGHPAKRQTRTRKRSQGQKP
jgi:hypothetical protein